MQSSNALRDPGFIRYWSTIRRHLWLIAACTVATLGAALIYVTVAPRSYTAQAQLLVNPVSQDNTALFSLPVLHSSGDPTRDVLTAAGLVTTPQVARDVISELHLNTTPSALLEKVSVTPIAQSNILSVQATAGSSAEAQQIANGFADATVASRTAVLHQALAKDIRQLQSTLASVPAAERSGPGSVGDELDQLEGLTGASDPTLTVAAPAELPTAQASPRTTLSLLAGLLAGLLIGITAAFVRDALDPRVQREQQLRERFPLPVLARVPKVGKRREERTLLPRQLPLTAIEQYRTLRAKLTTGGGEAQAYLLTGSGLREGKSTSAIALAAALAHGGNDVILIEADLRNPTLATSLKLGSFGGIERVLTDEVPLHEALTEVQLDGAPMRILAAHRHPGGAVDRLSVPAARQLVQAAKELADFVVIDAPPLTEVVDALPMAQVVDQVVIVARFGVTRLGKLSDVCELLADQGVTPAGLLLTGVTDASPSSYYLLPQGGMLSQASAPSAAQEAQEPVAVAQGQSSHRVGEEARPHDEQSTAGGQSTYSQLMRLRRNGS